MFFGKDIPKTVLGRGYRLAKNDKISEIAIPDSDRKGHFWCFGTTRVGKTRVLENMVEQDIRKGYSVLVLDPKGDLDLLEKIVQVAYEEGREAELMLVTPIFPQVSAVIDPLSHYYMPEELVGHIVSGVSVGKEKFFYNVAYEISLVVVQSLLLMAKAEGKSPRFNLNDIKNRISREELERLKEEVAALEASDKQMDQGEFDEEKKQLIMDLEKILASPADYYGKVSSSLRVALMELTSGNIGKVVGKAPSNRFLNRLEEGKRVIMVVQLGAMLTRAAASTLGKVVVSMVQSFVGRVFASGREVSPPLCAYIDEAQNVLYHGIDDLFAKAGGAGVWVHGFAQSVSQIYKEIGKDFGNAILDNTNTKIFLRVPDPDTAKYVTGHFASHRIYSPILNVGGGMSVREVEEDLIKPSEVLNLPPRRFYLTTYSGPYIAESLDVSDPYLDIQVPEVVTRGEKWNWVPRTGWVSSQCS